MNIVRLKNQLNGKEEELKGRTEELSKLRADNEAVSSTITELIQVKTSPETYLANNETRMKDKDNVLLQTKEEKTGIRSENIYLLLKIKDLEGNALNASKLLRIIELLKNDITEMNSCNKK
ncbi:hypothetical protein scyTo_0001063 [Scyliorhinus torazame]|uniref:Uncharacterized protein n=1 Tax=Scyliorhinus torazame TaxID=75743 RepID=A0A401P8M1_SCYTO|nr:hypothetical protein [Scyliorhinus torazame]